MLETLRRVDAFLETQFIDVHSVSPDMRKIQHPVLVREENQPLCVYDAENVTSGLPSWVDLSRLEDVVFEGETVDRQTALDRASQTRAFLKNLGWSERAKYFSA